MKSMSVVTHGSIEAALLEQIEVQLSKQQNLKDMMAWALSQPNGTFLPQIVSNVIVQDEFTHDVIVPRSDGVVLVYDTT
jgi:hypothetical protein